MEEITGMTDKDLVKKYVSTRNQKYFSKIIEIYDKKLFNYIVRRIGHQETAKDVYQTVWLKIATSLDGYKEENKFSNYLFFIATNACFDYLRLIKKDNENLYREVVSEDGEQRDFIDNLPSETDDPEKENEAKEEKEMITKALKGLPDEQKDVILLRTKGLTFREIAEMKNISVNSVLSRYRYAVDKIKSSIAGGR